MNAIVAKKLNSWKSNELNITTHTKMATIKQPARGSWDCENELNPRAQLTREDVANIRFRRMQGERMSVVYEDYKHKLIGDKRAGFSKVWLHGS